MVALLGSSVVGWIVGDIDDDTREVVADGVGFGDAVEITVGDTDDDTCEVFADGVADVATIVVAWTKY